MPPDETDAMLRGERLSMRRARMGDAQALIEILVEPEVARWWGT